MRYSIYKYIKTLSDSIVEATNYINSNVNNIGLLSDCVDAAISIKESLIKNESIEIKEIDLFLDKVNEIIELIENNKEYISELSRLYDLSKEINNHCINDIKYKFRITFFAELGSKWDALDSLYREYISREDCEVTVVIAPIFRAIKTPNGETKSDIIYNDYLTPMGIKHILFKDYDIKKDLPDITFTSQPYEGVTPEQFWAENIVPYTRLVYVPYFTSTNMVSDESKYVQCKMPMQKLSWKVIGQSEKFNELYTKYSDNNGENLIVSGLPKWDWVVNMDKRQIDLPMGWEKLKGKKVVLRNFHYSLSEVNSFFEYIRNSIKEFENSDICHIYRFHPMMETMFNVYYPQFKAEWEKIKSELDNSKNFIIDRNEIYDYAFKFSDILLTVPSSLIYQYLLTKKPIVMVRWSGVEKAKEKDEMNENVLVKLTNLYCVENNEGIRDFYQKLLFENDDYEYDKRMKFINETFPYCDGNIGKNLANQLINELLKEDNIL